MGEQDRKAINAVEAAGSGTQKGKKPRKHASGTGADGAAANAPGDAWRPVEAGEDFHTGLDEDGFMGLEVLEAPKIFSTSKPAKGSGDTEAGTRGAAHATKPGKAGKQAKAAAPAASAPGSGGKQKQGKKRKSSAGAEGAGPSDEAAAAQPSGTAGPDAAAASAAGAAQDRGTPAAPAAAVGGGGIDDEVAAASRAKIAGNEKRRQEKLAALKEAARQAALARDEFVMPEGLSRKEQKQLLTKHKREKHKAAMKHKKAKIAERRRKYKMKKAAREGGAEGDSGSDSDSDADGEAPVVVSKSAKKPAAKKTASSPAAAQPEPTTDVSAWDVFGLHPGILRALAMQGFATPTPIQEACLMPAIRGRRDIIGAAQTGSGKTLAFGLPILQQLLAEGAGEAGGHAPRTGMPPSPLRGLILLPTRELALQVEQHLRAVAGRCGIGTAAIVGGLSALKQERVLSKRPAIIAATPGRLWDLMQDGGGASKHLVQLQRLDFLVLDEADRMVQQGHYQELGNIIEYVVANRGRGSGSGKPGGAAAAQGQPAGSGIDSNAERDELESDLADSDSEADSGEDQDAEEAESSSSSDDDGEAAATPPETEAAPAAGSDSRKQDGSAARPLQTFVFSATLTLPAGLRRRLRKGGGGAGGSGTLETLMDAVPFGERPKVVDLTGETRRLASGLSEAHLRCDERQRDEFLYYILAKHPGRTLVFVNAVSATRRLAALLGHLGIKAVALHASQQQRQRLKALDRFKTEPNGVLVATDVAARGLDVPDVRCVVHYQVPASADLYVHRSGRTARAAADGIAVALVTPSDSKRFDALQTALDRPAPPEFPVDESLLPAVHARVGLALRLDAFERTEAKRHADKSWMRAAAEDLGIQVDDGEVASDGEITKGRKRRELLRRMKKAGRKPDNGEERALRKELAQLLSEPLRPGFSQKYFTGGAAGAAAMLMHSGGAAAGADAQPGDGMMAVVAAAEKLQASRVAAADDVAAKQAAAAKRAKRAKAANGASAGAAPKQSGKKQKGKRKAEALDEAAAAKKQRKQDKYNNKRKGNNAVAGPAPMGRQAGGQDALAALQAHNKV